MNFMNLKTKIYIYERSGEKKPSLKIPPRNVEKKYYTYTNTSHQRQYQHLRYKLICISTHMTVFKYIPTTFNSEYLIVYVCIMYM